MECCIVSAKDENDKTMILSVINNGEREEIKIRSEICPIKAKTINLMPYHCTLYLDTNGNPESVSTTSCGMTLTDAPEEFQIKKKGKKTVITPK